MINSPKPTKLQIVAYTGIGNATKQPAMEVYSNPADISHTFNFEEPSSEKEGKDVDTIISAAVSNPPIAKPAKMVLKLQFDGTGILYDNEDKDVGKQIEDFLDYVYHIKKGTEPEKPYQIEVTWGRFNFRGWLVALSVNYKLFKGNGLPLRAEVDLTLSQTILPKKITTVAAVDEVETYQTLAGSLASALKSGNKAKAALQGAKLAYSTAKKVAGAGIFLHEVARENGLSNFRSVPAGTTIAVSNPPEAPPEEKKPIEVIAAPPAPTA